MGPRLSQPSPYVGGYRTLQTARGRAGALADDDFTGEAFGGDLFAAQEAGHGFDGGGAEAEFRLADGGEGHAKVFGDKDVAEADDGEVFRNANALVEQDTGGADGDEV